MSTATVLKFKQTLVESELVAEDILTAKQEVKLNLIFLFKQQDY